MRNTLRLLGLVAVGVALVALPTAPANAQETDTTTVTKGTVEIGAWDASDDGSPDVVTEYESNDGGPDVAVDVETRGEGGSFSLDARVRDDNDFDLGLDFEVGRMIRSHTSYTGLPHRLIHDDIDNLAAVTDHGRIVQETDLDPTAVYGIDYELLEHRTELQFPGASGLTVGIGYRNQTRDGLRQQVAVSHCDTCHAYSQSRPVDETTEDALIDLQYAWSGGMVRGELSHREFDEGTPFITLLYDDALHPEQRLPLFENRVQFDSADGPLPVDLVPEITKDRVKLEASFTDVHGFWVNLGGVYTETQNDTTNISSEYTGSVLSAVRRFKKGWNVAWKARAYTIETDDFFVDTAEPLGIAGPQAGRTYQEIYGFDPDFLRQSSTNRDVLESKLTVSRKLGKKAGTIKLLWDFENVDREYLAVAENGDTDTTENVFGISWWARPRKGLRVEAGLRHGEVDNPFLALDDQYSTLQSTTVASPFDPRSAQYYEFQNARIGDGTALPESWDEVKLRGSYTFGTSNFSTSYRWWDGDNTGGDLTDWARTNQTLMATLWMAPTPKWSWYATAAWNDTELDLAASIPLFDG